MENIENYEVLSVIGSGSFGTCYKVKHKTLFKEFVWKAVNYGQMSAEKKQSLVSEVNVLSKLRHPNIIRYFDHIIHKNSSTLYIIMEYCSGGDLSKVIKNCVESGKFLVENFIWRVLYQIASALNVCHCQCSATVLHRDIKPANVFLDSDYNVKLGDFGLAKIINDPENYTRTFVGTPLYMSPELIKNKKYNSKSDIWALGCLIYEICALKPPFSGNDFNNLSNKIKEGIFSRIPQHYSDDLQKLIVYLLSTDFEFRPTVDIILRHPTVVLKINKDIQSIYSENSQKPQQNCDKLIENLENFQIRLENIKNREAALKIKEKKLNDKEQVLNRREKKVVLLERFANEKLMRANLYLKQSKDKKTKTKKVVEDLDSSADPGDGSFIATSSKINEQNIVKPKYFVRSERKVCFKEIRGSDSVLFDKCNSLNKQMPNISSRKSKSSNNISEIKSILKLNAECEKENIKHTKL